MRETRAFGCLQVVALALAGALCACLPAGAQSDPDAMKKLMERIDQLERRLSEQEAKNARLEAQIDTLTQPAAQAQAAPAKPAAPAPAAAGPASPGSPSKAAWELYGYAKLDAIWDSNRIYPGDYALWVQPENASGRHSEFMATANQTRLGLNVRGPSDSAALASGKVEIDFYGGGAENKANPMMRQAYMQVDWPAHDVSLLAGQTADVISPLTAPTVNYTVGWYAGNIGYRHPQLRLTKGFDFEGGSRALLQIAAVRTMGHLVEGQNTGSDSGFPTLQGRAAFSFPASGGKKATFGLSGHYGEEAYPPAHPRQPDVTYPSWSANLDFSVPLGRRLLLTGEGFTGRDLDAYLGGSSEAVNVSKRTSTASSGGWLALGIGGFERMSFNLGASVDDPRNADLSPGARCRNLSVFGNGAFNITKSAQFLVELSYWDTRYLDRPKVHATRVQMAFQYSF
jgi:hypothetical protein